MSLLKTAIELAGPVRLKFAQLGNVMCAMCVSKYCIVLTEFHFVQIKRSIIVKYGAVMLAKGAAELVSDFGMNKHKSRWF